MAPTAERRFVLKKTKEFVTADYILEEGIPTEEYEKVTVAAERARDEIKHLVAMAEAKEEKLSAAIEANQDRAQELKQSNEAVQQHINNEFGKAIAQLEAKRDTLLRMAQSCYVDRGKELATQRDTLTEAKKKTAQATKAAEQALEQDDKAIIMLQERMAELIGDMPAEKEETNLEPVVSAFMSMEPEHVYMTFSGNELKLVEDEATLTAYSDMRMVSKPGTAIKTNVPTFGGNNVRFSATGLPHGLELNSTTGEIRGAASQECVGDITVCARNCRGNAKIILSYSFQNCAAAPGKTIVFNGWEYCLLCGSDPDADSEIVHNPQSWTMLQGWELLPSADDDVIKVVHAHIWASWGIGCASGYYNTGKKATSGFFKYQTDLFSQSGTTVTSKHEKLRIAMRKKL